MNNAEKTHKNLPVIPENARTIIIILGQCSLPSGEPHQWVIDRVNLAYTLMIKQKLDISTTYLIVTGADVSNRVHKIVDKDKMHQSEAKLMYKQLNKINEKQKYFMSESSQEENNSKNGNFSSHIIIEDQAETTIENFYYAFKIIVQSNLASKINDIYVITSDFHMKRAKSIFDKMFFNGNKQIISDSKKFNYQKQVHFVESKSLWKDEQGKEQMDKKFIKEQQLYHRPFLQQQAIITAKILWTQIQQFYKTKE